jgi:hypothetical protein
LKSWISISTGEEDEGSVPSLVEELALREEKVMKQLSTQMLPPPLGYVVNKPEPDRPLNRPPVAQNKEVTLPSNPNLSNPLLLTPDCNLEATERQVLPLPLTPHHELETK